MIYREQRLKSRGCGTADKFAGQGSNASLSVRRDAFCFDKVPVWVLLCCRHHDGVRSHQKP